MPSDPAANTPALRIQNLTFRYRRRDEPAIRELCFEMQPGEVMLVAGVNDGDASIEAIARVLETLSGIFA